MGLAYFLFLLRFSYTFGFEQKNQHDPINDNLDSPFQNLLKPKDSTHSVTSNIQRIDFQNNYSLPFDIFVAIRKSNITSLNSKNEYFKKHHTRKRRLAYVERIYKNRTNTDKLRSRYGITPFWRPSAHAKLALSHRNDSSKEFSLPPKKPEKHSNDEDSADVGPIQPKLEIFDASSDEIKPGVVKTVVKRIMYVQRNTKVKLVHNKTQSGRNYKKTGKKPRTASAKDIKSRQWGTARQRGSNFYSRLWNLFTRANNIYRGVSAQASAMGLWEYKNFVAGYHAGNCFKYKDMILEESGIMIYDADSKWNTDQVDKFSQLLDLSLKMIDNCETAYKVWFQG